MIEFDKVTKRLGDRVVVDGVSLRARAGQVTALVGPTGAGKSMLLRCLCGLVVPNAGEVRVLGSRPDQLAIPGRHIGVAMDINSLHPGRTGRESLRLALMATRMPGSNMAGIIDRVGLTGADQRVGKYTKDQAERLAIGLALAGQPSALVIDEPLQCLEPTSHEWFRGLIGSFTRRGGAVLLTAQSLDQVDGLADGVVEIAKGRIVRHDGGDEAPSEQANSPVSSAQRIMSMLGEGVSRRSIGAAL